LRTNAHKDPNAEPNIYRKAALVTPTNIEKVLSVHRISSPIPLALQRENRVKVILVLADRKELIPNRLRSLDEGAINRGNLLALFLPADDSRFTFSKLLLESDRGAGKDLLSLVASGGLPRPTEPVVQTKTPSADRALRALQRGGPFTAVVRESGQPSGPRIWRIDYRNASEWNSQLLESPPGDLPVGFRTMFSHGVFTQVFPNTIPIDRYLSPTQLAAISESFTWEQHVAALDTLVKEGALSPEEVTSAEHFDPGTIMNPTPGLVGYGLPDDYSMRNPTARELNDGTIEVRADDVILTISRDGAPIRQRWRDSDAAILEVLEFTRRR
jgi:hypothetical protein